MSADTVPSSSSSNARESQSGTKEMDATIYIYEISETERNNVCYFIDQSGIWEEIAKKMGYNTASIIVSVHYFKYTKFIFLSIVTIFT